MTLLEAQYPPPDAVNSASIPCGHCKLPVGSPCGCDTRYWEARRLCVEARVKQAKAEHGVAL